SPPALPPAPVTVTAPVANEFWMMPVVPAMLPLPPNPFWPTRPPTEALAPPVTAPAASDCAMVEPATLEPTRPPALLKPPFGPVAPSPTVTVTLACAWVIEPAVAGPRIPFWPTRPPTRRPCSDTLLGLPLTVPLAVTLSMVPAFDPAKVPTNCPGKLALRLALALTLAL